MMKSFLEIPRKVYNASNSSRTDEEILIIGLLFVLLRGRGGRDGDGITKARLRRGITKARLTRGEFQVSLPFRVILTFDC